MQRQKQVLTLIAPVRIRIIAKYFGYLCIFLSVLPAGTLAASLIFMEFRFSPSSGAICVFLIILGLSLVRLKAPKDIKRHEALVITALVFIFSSAVMTYPFTVAGLSAMDAWFEAVSAVTTTGLSTLSTVESMPRTFLFARSFLQWTGGLGFVVFSVALLVGPSQTARHLMNFDEREDILEGTGSHARQVMTVYMLLTVTGIGLLFLEGVPLYSSLLHTLSAVSTGGFSIYDRSLAGLGGWTVQTTVMLIALSGSLPIILYSRSYRKGIRHFLDDMQVRALIITVLLFSALMIAALKSGGMSWEHSLHHAPLMAMTSQTTTGFATMNIAEINMPAKGLLLVSMTIGAAAGSTAGGMKIFRLLVFFKILLLTIQKTLLPSHAVANPHLQGRRISEDDINGTLVVMLLFVIMILLSWLVFLAAGYAPLDSLFDVVSATCTVGLSTGIVSSSLPVTLKTVLCADMLFGRVEIIAMLVLLYPGTWLRGKGNQV